MLTYLPHRIVIQNETRTLFEGGAYTTSWTTSSVEWANVQSINANETYSKEKKQQITKFKIIMRYNANIKNEQRILFNNNILHIENVIDSINRNKMIELICRLEQTQSIIINPSNTPPVANAGTLSVIEDTTTTGTLTASDVDGNTLTYSIVTQGTKGTATITNSSNGTYNYVPNLNANGSDSFTFKVNDGFIDSNIATISVTISAINDIPIANAGTLSVIQNTTTTGTLTASDVDGNNLTYSIVSQGTKGTATITNSSNGLYSYAPINNQFGSDSFTFKVNDGIVDSAPATISVTISQAIAWTPANISTALWLDASDSSTIILNGSNVSQWNDKSGNGRNVTQGTAVNQPTYTANALNSKSAVTFDGNDYLTSQTWTNSGDVSIYAVLNKNNTAGNWDGIFMIGPDNQNDFWMGAYDNSPTKARHGYASIESNLDINDYYIGNTAGLYGVVTTGSTLYGLRNGSSLGSITATSLPSSIRKVSIGVSTVPSGCLKGKLYEVIFVNSNLSLADRQKIEGYLAHKWGLTANLPSDHPYKTTPPTN